MAKAKPTTFTPERLRIIESRLLNRLRRSPSGCWEWTGPTDKDGYPSWSVPGLGLAHRIAYRLFCGDLSAGRCVCHSCDNPRCCHPAHLFIGSDLDNARDRARKGRSVRGERCHLAKLNETAVRAIRADYATGRYTFDMLGRKYGVTPRNAHAIVRRKSWAHVV